MYKKVGLLIFIILCLSSTIVNAFVGVQFGTSLVNTSQVSLGEIVVNEGESIQDAINNATANDTIRVMSGIYPEQIDVTKPVKLVGEDPATTIIDGENKNQTIVTVLAPNVEIRGFTIQNAGMNSYMTPTGIQIWNNMSTIIRENILRNNFLSIWLAESNSCQIADNIITDSYTGVLLSDSCFNRIVGNNIKNNVIGVRLSSLESENNTLFHNNFIDNVSWQVDPTGMGNNTIWDNSAEGNYWSDYAGGDLDGDGIGDTPYPNEFGWDEHPLMELWSLFRVHGVQWNGQNFNVTTYCNSTVASFNFSQSEKQVSFNVTGPSGVLGFCNVTIPKSLLNASSNGWIVFRDSVNMTDDVVVGENGTHSSIYFVFSLGKYNVKIIGTDVIPEFPTPLFFAMFMIVTMIATILAKRRDRVDFCNGDSTGL